MLLMYWLASALAYFASERVFVLFHPLVRLVGFFRHLVKSFFLVFGQRIFAASRFHVLPNELLYVVHGEYLADVCFSDNIPPNKPHMLDL